MKKGYKAIGMDSHIGPGFDVLCEYVDPASDPGSRRWRSIDKRMGKISRWPPTSGPDTPDINPTRNRRRFLAVRRVGAATAGDDQGLR